MLPDGYAMPNSNTIRDGTRGSHLVPSPPVGEGDSEVSTNSVG
jgi:hypothetical protein